MRPTRIAVIGTGRMGSALALRLAAAGHEVRMGSRDPVRGGHKAAELGAAFGGAYPTAVANAEVVILAVPWTAVFDTLDLLGGLGDAVVVDVTNPFDQGGRVETSGAERIQARLPGPRVVKAWNTVDSAVIRRSADFAGVAPTIFVAGDDRPAKDLVAALVADIGYEPVDAGPLRSSRYLEPLAGLMTTLDRQAGGELEHGLKLLRRARPRPRPQTPVARRTSARDPASEKKRRVARLPGRL